MEGLHSRKHVPASSPTNFYQTFGGANLNFAQNKYQSDYLPVTNGEYYRGGFLMSKDTLINTCGS